MEDESKRPGLPVCILVTAGEGNGELMCLRMSCPGGIEQVLAIEGGTACVLVHDAERIEARHGLALDAGTIEQALGAAIDGALLVAWDLEAVAGALRAYHPAPETLLARAPLELDLRAATLLVGVADDTLAPTVNGLADRLGLVPPGESVRDRALFVAQVVRRLVSSGAWLARVLALGGDERRILRTCVRRLGEGERTYGPWNLDDDRAYAREAYEEVIDGLHYAAAGLLRLQDRAGTKEGG